MKAAEGDVGFRAQGSGLSKREKVLLGGGLLLASALAWVVTFEVADIVRMGLPGFVALWTVMMAAMMLPSILPVALLFATLSSSRAELGLRPAPVTIFGIGYIATWTLLGVGVGLAKESLGPLASAGGQPLVAAALIVAGAFQLTRWKEFCLGQCRSPMHFFMDHWRDGRTGAALMGAHHGAYCIGCCWGFMVALIALGMMNLVWMVLVAVAVFAEKAAPGGPRLAAVIGGALILAGIALVVATLPPLGGM